jgi:hypothetical protein
MAKKPAAPQESSKTTKPKKSEAKTTEPKTPESASPAPKVLTKSKKIPKLAKKDKHRLPRKEKKAKKKAEQMAALKA